MCLFHTFGLKEKYGQSLFSSYLLWVTGVHLLFLSSDPELADSRLTPDIVWRHWAAPGSRRILALLIHQDAYLITDSVSNHMAESQSQLHGHPLLPRTLLSAGGTDRRVVTGIQCSPLRAARDLSDQPHLIAQFSVLEPTWESCSIEVSMKVCVFF